MRRTLLTTLLVLAVATAAAAQDKQDAGPKWRWFKWKDFGVLMEAPQEAAFVMKERAAGWGELHGAAGEAHFVVLCRLGKQATPEEIRDFAVKEFGVARVNWEEFDKGENTSGWNWYRSYVAKTDNKAYMAAMGTGKKGSYLIYLKTTADDLEYFKKGYRRWYDSISLVD